MYARVQNNVNIAVAILAVPVLAVLLWNLFDLRGMMFIAAVPLAVIGILIGSQKWKLSVYLFMIWLIIEGALRKWFLPEYSSYIFLFKYLILLCPVFHFLTYGVSIKKRDYPFYPFIILYLMWGIFELINPLVTNDIRVKLLGIMVHFAFIPLLYFVPLLLNDTDKIVRLFKAAIIISIPIFILGIYQYYSPMDSPVNKYIGEDNIIAQAAGKVRVTSVFSYISTYAAYLTVITLVIFITIVISRMKKITTIIVYISAFLAIVNAFMTGSRGVVYLILLAVIILLVLMLFLGLIKKKKNILAISALAMVSICTILYTGYGRESMRTFTERAEKAGSVKDRVLSSVYPANFISQAGLVGLGIGKAYQGSTSFVGDNAGILLYSEAENEKLVLEMGILGYLIFILLKFSIFIFSINTFRKARDRADKIILLSLIVYQIPIIIGMQGIIYNTLSGAIYWFCIGLIVSINRNVREFNTKGFSYAPV